MTTDRGFPSLIFSETADLCDESGVLSEMPEFSDRGELRRRFLKGLGRSREGFFRFCAMRTEAPAYRIYDLSSFGPFRAVFAEKTVLLSTPVTVAFLAPSAAHFYPLMSPSSAYYADAVNRILFELMYLMKGGSPAFSSLSPEVYAVAERIPHLAEALFSRRCGVRCCDLEKILKTLVAGLDAVPAVRECRVDLASGRSSAGSDAGEIPAELPVEAFVSVLTALLCMAANLTADGNLAFTLTDHGRIREVSLRFLTDCLARSPQDEGPDALYDLPADFHRNVRYVSALCALTHMDLSVSSPDPGNGRRIRPLTVSLLVGAEPPPVLDFKYSEPEKAVPGILSETAALFA